MALEKAKFFLIACAALSVASWGSLPTEGEWWKTGAMYQIYPRSFQDSDGDGMGDLKGIKQRLPYLKELGVKMIWLSPVMKSPMLDGGYDIADYFDIDPLFGSLADMKDLLAAANEMGIRFLMDFVPNHNSVASTWFKESAASKESPKRDWYIWHPGNLLPNGTRVPPNNWASNFGGGLGSSWTWHEQTKEFYYHAFGSIDADLNYRNPEVVDAVKDIMRFWMRLGVGGFRVDAVPFLLEDLRLLDEDVNETCATANPIWNCMNHTYTQNNPGNFDIIRGWRELADEHGAVLFGEIYADLHKIMEYYGTFEQPLFHVPFNFNLLGGSYGSPNNLKNAAVVRDAIRNYAEAKPVWAHGNWVLGNHDNARLMQRLGNDTVLSTAVYALTNLLPGTPTIYNGDEICMSDLYIPYEDCVDPMCISNPKNFATAGRDPERTPMQWSSRAQAGFSSNSHTWLPINPDYVSINVETEKADPSSPLSIMTSTLAWRSSFPALALGRIAWVPDESEIPDSLQKYVVIVQSLVAQSTVVTVANWNTLRSLSFDLRSLVRQGSYKEWQLLFSTDRYRSRGAIDMNHFSLSPGEVAVVSPLEASNLSAGAQHKDLTRMISLTVASIVGGAAALMTLAVWSRHYTPQQPPLLG